MVRQLYEGFLEDEAQYAACERYWRDLIEGIAESVGQAGEWPPWQSKHHLNGTSMDRDLVWMFDGKSRRLDRAFTIYQMAMGEADDVWIGAYVKTRLPSSPRHYFPRDHLVMRLGLSEESSEIAEQLLRKWMLPSTTGKEMQAYIDEMLPDDEDEAG